MVRYKGNYRTDARDSMRGGVGTIQIEHLFEPGTEIKSPLRMVAKITIPVDGSIGLHEHQKEEEIFFIVDGEGEVNDNGTFKHVGAGDSIITGDGCSHAIKNTGKCNLSLVAIIGKHVN